MKLSNNRAGGHWQSFSYGFLHLSYRDFSFIEEIFINIVLIVSMNRFIHNCNKEWMESVCNCPKIINILVESSSFIVFEKIKQLLKEFKDKV